MSEPTWPDEPPVVQAPPGAPAGARSHARVAGAVEEDEALAEESAWQSAVVRVGTVLALWLGY